MFFKRDEIYFLLFTEEKKVKNLQQWQHGWQQDLHLEGYLAAALGKFLVRRKKLWKMLTSR